jgi:hypothetical protein
LKQSEAAQAWAEYLASKGHRVEQKVEILLSRNSTRKRFYWLVYASVRARKSFSRAQLSRIRKALSRCEQNSATVYVVVCFTRPERKFVAASGEYVLNNRELRADKGGILF